MRSLLKAPENDSVLGRQIALFAACVLPIYKMLEAPSLLARFSGGDLLLPALLHYLAQAGVLIGLLYTASKSDKPLFVRLEERLGKGMLVFYALYICFFLFAAVLPLLDLEKFVYAIFYDTSPTAFAFTFFFFFSAFVCSRGIKALGRFGDLSVFLFLFPFIILLVMSVAEADASNLLPFFEREFGHTMYAMKYTSPHFIDVALLLPLIGNLRYQKNDGKKIVGGYAVGCVCTLLFLGVFYGLFSSIAPRVHYAFAQIAQYFPALTVIGRIDLMFVYLLCIVLFVYVATPLHYAVDLFSRTVGTKRRTLFALVLNLIAFLFTLFFNRFYNDVYSFYARVAFVVCSLFSNLLPSCLSLFFLWKRKEKKIKEEMSHA